MDVAKTCKSTTGPSTRTWTLRHWQLTVRLGRVAQGAGCMQNTSRSSWPCRLAGPPSAYPCTCRWAIRGRWCR
eukprot:12788191-Alexandrium_andersonii.AAC.1